MKKIFPDLWRPSRYNKEKSTVTSFLLTDDGIIISQKDLAVTVKDKPIMIAVKLSPAEALALATRIKAEAEKLILSWEEKKEEKKDKGEDIEIKVVEVVP